jgi:transglutaminase-like putative cysteine protease
MRFGAIHRLFTNTLAALGVLAIISTSSLSTLTNGVLLVGLVVAMLVPESWAQRPQMQTLATFGPLAVLGNAIVQVARGAPAVEVAVEFASVLQIVRLITRRGAAHDQQIILLALLHFIAGTVLGGSFAYGLCFVAFVLVAPSALVLSHLRREVEGNYRQGARDRTGLPVDVPRILRSRRVVGRGFLAGTVALAVPVLTLTILLFVLFPRVGLALFTANHGRSGTMIGFSDHVDLGQVGVLRSNSALALRFEVPELSEPPPHYPVRFRGAAFDTYDGRAWSRSNTGRDSTRGATSTLRDGLALGKPTSRLIIDLEPIDPPVVFVPEGTVALSVMPHQTALNLPVELTRGHDQDFRYTNQDLRGLRYEVSVGRDALRHADSSAPDRVARYLTLPQLLSERVRKLAVELTQEAPTAGTKAKAVLQYLRRNFRYGLDSPSGGKPDPLDHFLFESHAGHCEFFSTAMAILLRAVGVPTRNVTGLVGGTFNRFGQFYAVRQGDAHSWVEVLQVEEYGRGIWHTYDPTPPAGTVSVASPAGARGYLFDLVDALAQRWNRYVIGYDMRLQTSVFSAIARKTGVHRADIERPPLRKIAVLAGIGVAVGAAVHFWRRRRAAIASRDGVPKPGRDAERSVALYRDLEGALALHGFVRSEATPPLRFAAEVGSASPTLAVDVLSLTEQYLEARWGGKTISFGDESSYRSRVKAIRSARSRP